MGLMLTEVICMVVNKITQAITSLEEARDETDKELGTSMMISEQIEQLRDLRDRYREINDDN